jgi:hypothetical protein
MCGSELTDVSTAGLKLVNAGERQRARLIEQSTFLLRKPFRCRWSELLNWRSQSGGILYFTTLNHLAPSGFLEHIMNDNN